MRSTLSRCTVAVLAILVMVAGAVVPAAAASASAALQAAPVAAVSPTPVSAAAVTGFQAGNIIDDAVFFARGTMNASQIQTFLNDRVPNCQSGYTCLKDYGQATTSRAADAMCAGYTGQGRESAAQIIFNVAQSCGINPQVILVTLQKEQGLVTHTWPSDWRYTSAMGQGCPDTAACDTRYYGFFNQVYGAAWQFKRYANPTGTSQYFTWYAPGKTWNVRFHPNAGCGTSPVYIANQATADLYYYTPYQPNGASLAAGYGEGDGCSSYGNRNFHNYFTAWFGSTRSPMGNAINDKYAELGGSGGYLGARVGDVVCGLRDSGCYQAYQSGRIHWTQASGAHATTGGIVNAWAAVNWENGPLGYPTTEQTCGITGGGCYQMFQHGQIHWSPTTGARASWGPTLEKWASLGHERGTLGYPTGQPTCTLSDGGCYQNFQNGKIHWSSSTGARATWGPMAATWANLSYERGALGYPTSDPTCNLRDGGCYQKFQKGLIHWTATTGARATTGAMLTTWAKHSYERGSLGFPTGNMTCTLRDGGCYQKFEKGMIHSSKATGARATWGPIAQAWAELSYERGTLGYPKSDPTCNLSGGGCYQKFESGLIHWSEATGARATTGAVMKLWSALSYERGALGMPTGDQTCNLRDGGCYQNFQNGRIHWSQATGAHATWGPIAAAWAGQSYERGALGYPKGEPVCNLRDGGCYQKFETGMIHWSVATGARATTGAVLDAWAASGYERGAYGFPIEDAVCAADGSCSQRFEKGTITTPSTAASRSTARSAQPDPSPSPSSEPTPTPTVSAPTESPTPSPSPSTSPGP